MMLPTKFLIITIITTLAESKSMHSREASEICDQMSNNSSRIQCYCVKDYTDLHYKMANCYLTNGIIEEVDKSWDTFGEISSVSKLVFSTTRGYTLTYIPTTALALMESALKIEIQYGDIKEIQSYAFANLTEVEEISLGSNNITMLHQHAFAHHRNLKKLNLERNEIVEINRDIFHELPSLTSLLFTGNKITTIHDKAFIHLSNLKELELNNNAIFSLNSETFAGLKSLRRLKLEYNALEVIGDNTFVPLKSLLYLNLESNKIAILDSKAFKGLSSLHTLSLAKNALDSINDVEVFKSLNSLKSINLSRNKLKELNVGVFAPIVENFYSKSTVFDVEENEFPCQCQLDWFLSLKEKTSNGALKLAIENLKCIPDAKLAETWKKMKIEEENERTSTSAFDEIDNKNIDYEFYDESELGGKLFYVDIRDLINCTTKFESKDTEATTRSFEAIVTTKAPSSPIPSSTFKTVETTTTSVAPIAKSTKYVSKGVLDLSTEEIESETTTKESQKALNLEDHSKVSTSPMPTVSARTFVKTHDHEMASDEAVSEIKSYRSVHNEIVATPTVKHNFATRTYYFNVCLFIPIILTLFRYK